LAICRLVGLLGVLLSSCTLAPPAALPTPTASPNFVWLTNTPQLVVTVEPSATRPPPTLTPNLPDLPEVPTVDPDVVNQSPYLYNAQAGDTIQSLAARFAVLPQEIESPDPIPDNGLINPNQLLIIPRRLFNTTSSQRIMPDSEVVYSRSAIDFDIFPFVDAAGGFLGGYKEFLGSTGSTFGSAVIERVALENSVNPRLLLSLLQFQSNWVYGQPPDDIKRRFPMGHLEGSDDELFFQMVWAADQLSIGYYGWREGTLTEIQFVDGVTARLAPDLNAGTVALYYFFAQLYGSEDWLTAVNPDSGHPALHTSMFDDPWDRALVVEPLYPPTLTQPNMILPFAYDQIWAYTGGPHGAWTREGARAALDFAPGSIETGCAPSNNLVMAAAPGLVVRSGVGVLVLDLDGDGREQTGWVLAYLHLASENKIPVGSWVTQGQFIGNPSCEGGFSTGTHIHVARKYNGEWILADGPLPFVLSGWTAHAGPLAYQGTLERELVVIKANTSGNAASRIIRRQDDP
jgi:murein DD-endopeptidase MepM/ murein hydrolase activator NlpD